VIGDPRLGNRKEVRTAQEQLRARLRKSADQLTVQMDKLADAEDACKKMETQLKDLEGTTADSLRKRTKAIQDTIRVIRDFISGKQQTRQGYGQVPQITVLNQLQQANQYIGSKPVMPGPQEQMLVERAEKLITEANSRIESFLQGPWKIYKEQVEQAKLSPIR
jgi:hypothetical protein